MGCRRVPPIHSYLLLPPAAGSGAPAPAAPKTPASRSDPRGGEASHEMIALVSNNNNAADATDATIDADADAADADAADANSI